MKRKKQLSILKWICSVIKNYKRYVVFLSLLQFMIGASTIYLAIVLRNAIDSAVQGKGQIFWGNVLFYIGLVGIQLCLHAIRRHIEEYSRSVLENVFKKRILGTFMYDDYASVMSIHSGEWMNRFTTDTRIVAEGVVDIIPGVVGLLVKMFGALGAIVLLEPILGYIFIPGGIFLGLVTFLFRSIIKNYHKKVREADGDLRVFVQEVLQSQLVIRAFVKEKSIWKKSLKFMEQHRHARMKKNIVSNVCNLGYGGIIQITYIIGLVVCGQGILQGRITYGTMTAILQLITQVQAPVANISGYFPKFYAMLASAERLLEGEKDNHVIAQKESKELAEINSIYTIKMKKLLIEDLSFGYPTMEEGIEGGRTTIFNGINLVIDKGEYLALTGPSGCGKSTLLKLIMGIYSPVKGSISMLLMDEKCPMEDTWRRLFAYVPQGNQLMCGSIREIVSFMETEEVVQDERIWNALEMACAKEFVKELPKGLDTVLGELGAGLSEGQMQRIAIARAIYVDSPILLLDEATSALDEKTEATILSNLRDMTDKTVIIVTHRPAALQICDREIEISEKGCYIKSK